MLKQRHDTGFLTCSAPKGSCASSPTMPTPAPVRPAASAETQDKPRPDPPIDSFTYIHTDSRPDMVTTNALSLASPQLSSSRLACPAARSPTGKRLPPAPDESLGERLPRTSPGTCTCTRHRRPRCRCLGCFGNISSSSGHRSGGRSVINARGSGGSGDGCGGYRGC